MGTAGEWDLCIPLSDSMNDHLDALVGCMLALSPLWFVSLVALITSSLVQGVTEMARQAADKLEIGSKIDILPGIVLLTHESLLGEKVRRFVRSLASAPCAATQRNHALCHDFLFKKCTSI